MVFLELLVLVTVEFVFFQVHIVDVVFLTLNVSFLGKFCFLYNLISYLNVFHSKLVQNARCSLVIVFVIVYFLCLVVVVFHRFVLRFSETLLKRRDFRQ